jgi:hypothetical protein
MRPGKNEAPGAGTPSASGSDPREQDLGTNHTPAEKPFAVWCVKHDGHRYLFQRYATRAEADAVAKTLRGVGCAAEVEPRS